MARGHSQRDVVANIYQFKVNLIGRVYLFYDVALLGVNLWGNLTPFWGSQWGVADVSSVMSTLKMNKITQHRGRERPTVSSDVAVCSLGLEGILVVPGDMFLSIAKVLAWRCEPVCRATFGPVVHAKQSL